MNIFSILPIYADKWQEKDIRAFDPEEIAAVESAEVVTSSYGLSVCFMFKAGGQSYIPLDINSTLNEGDTVDLTKAKIVTLSKTGQKDIFRVRI
jgi:hypothetical protein